MRENEKNQKIKAYMDDIEYSKRSIEQHEKNIKEYKKKIEEIKYTRKYLIRVYDDNKLIKSWDEEIDSRFLNLRMSELNSELNGKKLNTERTTASGVTYRITPNRYYIVTDVYLED